MCRTVLRRSLGFRCRPLLVLTLPDPPPAGGPQTIRVNITPTHATNTFKPTEAMGAGVDRIPLAATDKIFTESVLKKILSTGWQTVTYRQNTELYVEAWHWNPKGKWSEAGEKGYFVGDSEPAEF